MVKDFIDIDPYKFKKARKFLQALDVLGISQSDFLAIFEINNLLLEKNKKLEKEIEMLKEDVKKLLDNDTRQLVEVQNGQSKNLVKTAREYMELKEEFYPYGKPIKSVNNKQ
jgi:hypothetical protein